MIPPASGCCYSEPSRWLPVSALFSSSSFCFDFPLCDGLSHASPEEARRARNAPVDGLTLATELLQPRFFPTVSNAGSFLQEPRGHGRYHLHSMGDARHAPANIYSLLIVDVMRLPVSPGNKHTICGRQARMHRSYLHYFPATGINRFPTDGVPPKTNEKDLSPIS
ncbi:hypothetical protein VTN02DRAFT_5515 [Thermoascus thermophilus]